MPTTGWPLVGRSGTLRRIVAAAHSGRLSGMVLVGPAGVGRTRLARAALAAVCGDAAGWAPYWVMAGSSTASIPLGALAHLLPDLDPALPEPQLLREARRRLLESAGEARPVLAVDDAHVLDETSAILLQRLAGAGDAFVVVTAPAGVRVPPPVFALWKDGLAERVDITELDRAQSDRLVTRALTEDAGLVDAAALDRLWRLARGNPLFLRELVEGARAAGTLHRTGSVWRWDGPFPRTPRLAEMVEEQLGTLAPAEQDLLRILAFGEPLVSDVAARLAGPEVLAAAESRGWLTSVRNGRRVELRLTHPLHAEILRTLASPLQEREVYRRLSEASAGLDAGAAGDDGTAATDGLLRSRAVSWRAAQGLPVPAAELIDAADSLLAGDPQAAIRLLGTLPGSPLAGHDGTGTGTGEPGPRPAELRLRLARVWIRLGEAERAEDVLAPAPSGRPAARSGGMTQRAGGSGGSTQTVGAVGPDRPVEPVEPVDLEAAVVRVHNLYWGLRAFDRAGEVLRAVTDRPVDPDRPGGAEAQVVLRAFRELLEGRSEDGARVAATAADDPGAGTAALAVAALASARAGHYVAAIGYTDRAGPLPPPRITDDDGAGGWLRFQLLAARWYALLQTGDLDGAGELSAVCHRASLAAGQARYAALFGTWSGIVEGRRGRLRTATGRLLEAAASVPADRFSFTMPLVGELAVAMAGTGRATRARAVLAEGERIPGDMLLAGWTHPARVFLAGAEGRTSHAAALALAVDGAAVERSVVHGEAGPGGRGPGPSGPVAEARGHRLQALHAAVRTGATGAVADRLVVLAARAEGPLERAYGTHAHALAARDGGGLDRVAVTFDGLGHRLLAAEAAAQAAHLHRAAGRTGAAGAAASRARAWAQDCEGAVTPALALLDGTGDLTPREHEIAALAATGMTSKAIAAELVVSVRTVDNVLRSVYAKLGVSGRGELTRVAGLGRSG